MAEAPPFARNTAMEKKSDFGLIGLAVMGQNLVLNVESRGFQVSVYNRTSSKKTRVELSSAVRVSRNL